MTKRLNSKHKVDRRLKVNLWGRQKSPFNTRAYPPGEHCQTKNSKLSDFGIQLQAKQKLKSYYGNMNERQFRNMYKKAIMKRGDTAENLIRLLERRLDAIIYRAKLATTIFSARQIINHGHVKVNNKKVNISSYLVKEEDTIEIRDKSKKIKSATKKDIINLLNFCIKNLELKDFFKNPEKKPIMLENLRSIFYRMELSEKETRILSSVFASLAKKGRLTK